jgi:hypothetical protein
LILLVGSVPRFGVLTLGCIAEPMVVEGGSRTEAAEQTPVQHVRFDQGCPGCRPPRRRAVQFNTVSAFGSGLNENAGLNIDEAAKSRIQRTCPFPLKTGRA